MKIKLEGLNFEGTIISKELYKKTHFLYGTFDEAIFRKCDFFDVDFDGVWMNDTIFDDCNFHDCLFYAIQAYGVKFSSSEFSGASFEGCNLTDSKFNKCAMKNVKFSSDNIGTITDLAGVQFGDPTVENFIFDGAEYSEDTVFPSGFDPKEIIGLVVQKK